MKFLPLKLASLLIPSFFVILVVIFFYPFFFKGLIPIPADITIGAYFPWLDYKWGTVTGIPVKNSLPSDVPSLTFPNKSLAIRLLLSGHLPDWNKFVLSGTELFQTNLNAIFDPLNVVYLFTDFVSGWSIQIILQPLVALISFYLLARHLKLSKLASLFGSVTFSFSGFFTTWVEYNAQSRSLALMPLVIFAALKSFDQPKVKNYALYSLVLGLQIFAGYPQFVLYTLLFVGVSSLFYSSPNLKRLIDLALFTALGLAFSGVQLLPLIDLFKTSTRLSDTGSLVITNFGFFPFKHLVTLVSPNFFGNPATLNYTGVGYFDNFSTYPGVLSLVLAFYSLRAKNSKTAVFWFGLALALLLSLKTPLSQFLFENNIPGFGTAIAARAMALFTFCLAVLSSIGLNHLLTQKKPSLFYFLAFLLLLAIFWLVPGALYLKVRHLEPLITTIQKTTLRNLVVPTLVIFAAALLFFFKRFFNDKFTHKYLLLVGLALIFIQFGDLFLFGKKYLSFVPRSYIFPSTPVIDYLRQNAGNDRISGGDVIPMNMWMPYDLKSAAGYEALYSTRYASFLGHLQGQDIPLGRVGNILTYPDTFDFNSTSTRFILAKKYDKGVPSPTGEIHTEFQLPHLKPVFSDGSVQILENIKSLPLVYLKYQDKSGITAIKDYTEYLNGDFDINVNSTSSAQLIIATTYSPSWKAKVDGRPHPVGISNNVYISLPDISTGSHKVKLVYNPRTFSVGLLSTLFSGLTILALILFRRKNHA